MKKGMILTLFAILTTVLFASNQTAIDYYDSGDIKSAKSIFAATTNPDALDYYYMGLINLKENNKTAATANFNKGLEKDPTNLFNSVGLATILMTTDARTANRTLKSISRDRKYKKDPKMLVAIGGAYAFNNNTSKKEEYLAKAKKVDKHSALPYIFEGNELMEKGKSNEAAVSFENALYFDPNSKVALVKLAQLYLGTRMSIAFDYLNKATTLDPNYEYGWKTAASLRYAKGFYPEAKTAFENYMKLINPRPEDYQTYGEILYFNKEYENALVALAKAPINTVTSRLKMYSLYSQNKYDEALPLAQNLLNESKKDELIWQDYSYYADILYKNKNYSEATKAYENAYLTDTTRTEIMKDIARAADRAGVYDKSTYYYQKILDSKSDAISLADMYSLGGSYYSAGIDTTNVKDKAKRTEYLKKADEVFKKQTELFPDHYLGYFSRARANSALDPETSAGLAKPYYEKALDVMMPNLDNYKNEILEVYQYLGIYYLQKDDYAKSREYWEKVLEISPENSIAKQVIRSFDAVNK